MTIFYGARDLDDAAPRPWLVAQRAVQITLGIVCGSAFALLLYVVIP